jgi:apolipoprotein N-acyltransferase
MGAALAASTTPARQSGWISSAIALIAGLVHAASVAWPFSQFLWFQAGQPVWWLQILALAVLAWQLRRCSHWRAGAWLGWLFGLAWLSGTFWWLFISMHTYGGLPAVLAVLAVLGLAGVLALYFALAGAVMVRCQPDGAGRGAVLFASLWTLAELARGHWLTGFGWGGSGYAHLDGLLAGYAPWVGVYGVGALAAWLAASLPQLLACSPWQRLVMLAVLTVPSVAQMDGTHFTQSSGELSVALLQGNIPQDEKFQSGTGVPMALQWYAQQFQANQASLVVAPETAIPVLPQQLPDDYWNALQARFATGEQAAMLGLPLGDYKTGYTNSMVALKPGQAQFWRYDKHHLVPFGEFIPPMFRWFTEMMSIPLGDFNRGSVGQASLDWQGQRLAANICYEDLYGNELAERFARPGLAPTIFVNSSNIGWFGNTVAIDQHLGLSRMRALEFERPFVRATNTGATVVIDHQGRVTAALPRHTQGVLRAQVQGRIGLTPFAWWASRFGFWPLWLLALGLVWATTRRAGAAPRA